MGSIIAPPLIAMNWVAIGREMTFVLLGALGLLWVIPWLIFNKALPNKHPWITTEERELIRSGMQPQQASRAQEGLSMVQILSHRAPWAVLISRFFIEPIWWLFVGWMPIYLADVYGFNVKEIGFFAWVPYVGAAVGSLTGGYFSGQIIIRGGSVDHARKRTILIGCIIMFLGLVATILFGNTPERFVLIVAGVLFGFQFIISNIQTIPSDLLSGKSVGSLAGLGGTVGIFSVILMNFLVPVITEHYSYTPIFIMIAVFVPLGYLSIRFFAKEIKPIDQ
ncbi:MAG: MFS transporter, partial [Salibacteraceae bacterium]